MRFFSASWLFGFDTRLTPFRSGAAAAAEAEKEEEDGSDKFAIGRAPYAMCANTTFVGKVRSALCNHCL
jgi:hypothetical protein